MRFALRHSTRSYILILVILCSCYTNAGAQSPKLNWLAFLDSVKSVADNDHYVYLYYYKAGQVERHFYCYQQNNQQVVAINVGDTMIRTAIINSPDIFRYIRSNKKYLSAVVNKNATEKGRADLVKQYMRDTVPFIQLGIRISGLHYNHFSRISQDSIASIKRDRLRQGYVAINTIIEWLEQGITKGQQRKQ